MESRATNLFGGAFYPGAYCKILEQYGDLIQEELIERETFNAPPSPEGEVKLENKIKFT